MNLISYEFLLQDCQPKDDDKQYIGHGRSLTKFKGLEGLFIQVENYH